MLAHHGLCKSRSSAALQSDEIEEAGLERVAIRAKATKPTRELEDFEDRASRTSLLAKGTASSRNETRSTSQRAFVPGASRNPSLASLEHEIPELVQRLRSNSPAFNGIQKQWAMRAVGNHNCCEAEPVPAREDLEKRAESHNHNPLLTLGLGCYPTTQ